MESGLYPLLALAGAAVGFILWSSLWPHSASGVASPLALLALAAGIALLPFSHGGPEQVLLLILFFSAAALEWLTRPEVADAALKERYALRLLAMCGGLVALVSANLAGLWLGLSLYRLATDLAASHPSRRPLALYLLALQALFWGLVMISVAGGPLYLTSLRRWIWQMGVPPSPPFLAGVGLAMGGILLATELIPLCDVLKGEGALAGPALGVALLLRLLLAGLDAWVDTWLTTLGGLALLLLFWGGWAATASAGPRLRLDRLLILQRGFLLLGLAMAWTIRGLQAVLSLSVAYLLGHSLLWALSEPAEGETPQTSLEGEGRASRWSRWGLALALCSLAGAPLTVGLPARLGLLGSMQSAGLGPLLAVGAAFWGVSAWLYGTVLFRLRDLPARHELPSLTQGVAMALSLIALVGLGLWPKPLFELAERLIGLLKL